MSRTRSTELVAWTVIHASAQPLWQGTPRAGDRQQVSPSQSTHGCGGPIWACRQSRTTGPPGTRLVAWDMPRSPVLRGRNWSGWPGRGMAVPQARHRLWSGDAELVSGDEGGRLHGQAQVRELDLAVDGRLAAVAGVGLAGDGAAEAGSPVGQGVE